MGAILDSDLRRPPTSPWAPVPVGTSGKTQGDTSATMLVEKSGRWQYGDEIDIRVRLNELECVALPGGAAQSLYWSGIEVSMDRQALPDSGGDHPWYITAALLPPSFLWHAEAPLLPGIHPRSPEWRGALQSFVAGDKPRFDPFEPDPARLVARLGDLTRPYWLNPLSPGDDCSTLVLRNPNRVSTTPRRWFFSLCPCEPSQVVLAVSGCIDDSIPVSPRKRGFSIPGAPASPRRKLDWNERQGTSTDYEYTPDSKQKALCLAMAVLQSLARENDSSAELERRVRSTYIEHVRNLDQRKQLQKDFSKSESEQVYRDFLRLHPECAGDDKSQRCRDLLFEHCHQTIARWRSQGRPFPED